MSVSSPRTVAIVDDDRNLRGALRDLLETAGFISVLYGSADDFIDSKGFLTVGCIIADVRMPGMSGVEMLQELRKYPACPPVLIMTSYADPKMKAAAIKNGAAGFLGKPINPSQLLVCIEKFFSDADDPASVSDQ